MRKIFILLFLYFFSFLNILAYEKPEIIPRSQWGADESYTYLNSPEWKQILEKWKNTPKKGLTEYQKKLANKKAEVDRIITTQFPETLRTNGKITEENGNKLAWPITYSSKIRAITIHHTESEYSDTITGLKQIYKFHSLGRTWGDIGYNFIIGYDGKIYEGRKGGETAVGAHSKYNNTQNIGISIMGSYQYKDISEKQYNSLKKLTFYLIEKYEIDLTKKQPFFLGCFTKDCKSPLTINYEYPLIGHRDATNTACPGDKLYAEIQNLRLKYMIKQINYKNLKKKYFPIFEKVGDEKLKSIQEKIQNYLKINKNQELQKLQKLLKDFLKKEKEVLLNIYNIFRV